ncbi:MAG: hypothetical protein EAZ43_12610 [Betaproteobacteria bacterium]|nr:MAG: hypothetical protein EAZ43_12610 [Betaproteobacteria bacterium]
MVNTQTRQQTLSGRTIPKQSNMLGRPPAPNSPENESIAAKIETTIRVLRLLALYRLVVAAALALLSIGSGFDPIVYAATFAYACWAVVSLFTFRKFQGRISSLLLVQLAIDLCFIGTVIAASRTSLTVYAAYLLPIAATHGWFYRSRTALAHAAIATLALLVLEWALHGGSTTALTQAAVVGAGYFLLTAVGMLLGSSAEESEQLALIRSEDVRRMAQINQLVISELKDGVVVVGAQGQIIMANPQARRWLTGDEAAMVGEQFLEDVAPNLGARWRSFFQHGSTIDTSPVRLLHNDAAEGETGIAKTKILTPRMTPIDLQERDGTLIFLEDTDAAQAEAQQIKLAALGRLSASIAHEIRNPLSAIKQAAQLVGEEVRDLPQLAALALMIDKNTERIDRIVRDVSLLGRRDRGTPVAVELRAFVHECVEELMPTLAAAHGFQLADGERVIVLVDAGHLEEMLINLLSNGWRHSKKLTASVRIVVSSNAETQRASIAVIDDGTGVPKAMRDKIFEPFFSGSGSTGLGLYLVSELAQANGGSVRLGQTVTGARFVLELPLAMR